MQIDNQFEVLLAPAEAWSLLMNVPLTASCFPGAELTETIAADRYKGRVTIRLGPATMVFSGNLQVEDRDDGQHSATVKATWTETRGRGNAVTLTRFTMQEHDGGTRVVVRTDLQLAGQVAQYGRGAGMVSEVSAQLIAKFAENLRAHIRAPSPVPGDPRTQQPLPSRQTEISVIELLWRALVNRFKRIFSSE
jgi:carbon monoxide dehydrogenase subunit G